MNLLSIFEDVNARHFDGFLEPPALRWNSRLRTSAGRFFPGSRKFFRQSPPVIEVAAYLKEEAEGLALVVDTIAHEMIHYWLWVRRRPYGHTEEFLSKMREMGVSRYNRVPRLRPYKYAYRCPACAREFLARKRLGVLACATCCQTHTGGRFDRKFELFLERSLSAGERAELVDEPVCASE